MPLVQRAAAVISLALLVTLLAGLVARRLFRLSYCFTVWLATVGVSDGLILLWPQRFYTWPFWMAKETTLAALKFGIALEITTLTYQAFPRARATVRGLTLFLLISLLALVLVRVPYRGDFATLALELQRRVANGTAIVVCGVWGLVIYHRLPLHFLHRAILAGLAVYLVVLTVANTLPLELGWRINQAANLADAAIWVSVAAYWVWVVWRPPPVSSDFIRHLQPWRNRG